MKLPSSKKSWKKRVILTVCALAIVFSGYAAFAYYNEMWPFNSGEDNGSKKPSTAEQDKLNKENSIEDKGKTQPSSSSVDQSQSPNEIPVSTNTSIVIDSLQQSNGSVTYSAKIANAGQTGKCSAVFSNDNARPVTRTTDISGSVCESSIPELEFTTVGTWALTLRYYTDNTQAVATKTIEVR